MARLKNSVIAVRLVSKLNHIQYLNVLKLFTRLLAPTRQGFLKTNYKSGFKLTTIIERKHNQVNGNGMALNPPDQKCSEELMRTKLVQRKIDRQKLYTGFPLISTR